MKVFITALLLMSFNFDANTSVISVDHDWWSIWGTVYHSDIDSPTRFSHRYVESHDEGPENDEELERKLRSAWKEKWGNYPERNIIKITDFGKGWVPGG